MWAVTAALLLATGQAAEVALDSGAVVDQQVPHAGRSLLPQHQQLLAETTSTPLEPKKNSSKSVVHSAAWEAKHAEQPKTTRHSALWEAKHPETNTLSSKVDLRKTIQGKDEDPKHQEEQGEQGKQEGQQGHDGHQGQEEEHEHGEEEEDDTHRAINVVVSVMLFASLTFMMSLFYLVNYPDPQIRAQAWRAVSQTIVIFCSVLVFNASNGFVTWHEPYSMAGSMAGLDSLQRLDILHRDSGEQPDTGDFILAMTQLAVWILAFQFAVSVCAGVVFWQPDKLITGTARPLGESALTDKQKNKIGEELKKGIKPTPTAADLEIATTASAMIIGHVAGFAGINAFGTLMQLNLTLTLQPYNPTTLQPYNPTTLQPYNPNPNPNTAPYPNQAFSCRCTRSRIAPAFASWPGASPSSALSAW